MLSKKDFMFNPFSGVLEEDIEKTLVPRFDVNDLLAKINSEKPLAIEFLGKQGRGKTSHLLFLQKKLPTFPIFKLKAGCSYTELFTNRANVLFIDSIHHLSIPNIIKLFKEKRIIVYTSHRSRKLECFIARKNIYTIKFGGINREILEKIINKRLNLALKKELATEKKIFPNSEIDFLIKKFGDNYRGIINKLYEKFA